MHDQLWWLNKPVCLEWPEKADETTAIAFRWIVEQIHRIHGALAPTRASEPRANRRKRRRRASIGSGYRRQDSTRRGNR
jgi:hypothetical protein